MYNTCGSIKQCTIYIIWTKQYYFHLLQDSALLILSSLVSTNAVESFNDIAFTKKPEHASINLKKSNKNVSIKYTYEIQRTCSTI